MAKLKRVTLEAGLGLVLLAFGMLVWIGLALYHDEIGDQFWSVHGYPNPVQWNIDPWMLPLLVGPLVVVSVVRLALWESGRARLKTSASNG